MITSFTCEGLEPVGLALQIMEKFLILKITKIELLRIRANPNDFSHAVILDIDVDPHLIVNPKINRQFIVKEFSRQAEFFNSGFVNINTVFV